LPELLNPLDGAKIQSYKSQLIDPLFANPNFVSYVKRKQNSLQRIDFTGKTTFDSFVGAITDQNSKKAFLTWFGQQLKLT